ncbi:MAG: hypothetical protein ACE5JS_21270 [Nitrospinota bacterium]
MGARRQFYEGIGVIIAVDREKSRLVIDHEEIKPMRDERRLFQFGKRITQL